MRIGANYLGDGRCEFVVWAPFLERVELRLLSGTDGETIPMHRDESSYWRVVTEGVSPGTFYLYRLNEDRERPDPASAYQPQGVHGPSQVIDHRAFNWGDGTWRGLTLSEMVIYEIHVGTFTREGSFDAIVPRLGELRDLGINTIQIMPVGQFPGERNWGYDGVYPFAVQNSYGGPEALKRLVNECHRNGMGVIIDVVYNHIGPEGNYLMDYGPYFTDRYRTPWGMAINFDGPYSNDVRNFFIENALHWFRDYHIDALRLDALHAIHDMTARPFLLELAEKVKELSDITGRKYYLIAEDESNNPTIVRPRDLGGYEIDALWCDDFHHSLHVLLTGEHQGYYADFNGTGDLVKSLKEGFVYSGQYSRFRKRNHGSPSVDIPAEKFVVFCQNHDQVGNRIWGERLAHLVSFEALKLAAGVVILSPYVPLLFMGEEYGETAPFLYFTSHSDPAIIEAVRKGRKEEFRSFDWDGEPPDPQNPETFKESRIIWEKRYKGHNLVLLNFYKELINLRGHIPALAHLDRACLDAWGLEDKKVVFVRRWKGDRGVLLIFNFDKTDVTFQITPSGRPLKKIMDSSDSLWSGPGGLLPVRLIDCMDSTMRGESLAIYLEEE